MLSVSHLMGLAALLIKEKWNKGQLRGALMFSLICAKINGWVNNGEAGSLRRHRVHYDVTVIFCSKETRTMAMWRAHWSDCHHPHLPRRLRRTGNEKMNTVLDGNPPSLWRHQMEFFHVSGPLCGKFTGELPSQMANDAEHWCFLWSALEQTVE